IQGRHFRFQSRLWSSKKPREDAGSLGSRPTSRWMENISYNRLCRCGTGVTAKAAALLLSDSSPNSYEYHRRFCKKTTSSRSHTSTGLLGNRWKTSISARSSASTTSRGLKRLMIIGQFPVSKQSLQKSTDIL